METLQDICKKQENPSNLSSIELANSIRTFVYNQRGKFKLQKGSPAPGLLTTKELDEMVVGAIALSVQYLKDDFQDMDFVICKWLELLLKAYDEPSGTVSFKRSRKTIAENRDSYNAKLSSRPL